MLLAPNIDSIYHVRNLWLIVHIQDFLCISLYTYLELFLSVNILLLHQLSIVCKMEIL